MPASGEQGRSDVVVGGQERLANLSAASFQLRVQSSEQLLRELATLRLILDQHLRRPDDCRLARQRLGQGRSQQPIVLPSGQQHRSAIVVALQGSRGRPASAPRDCFGPHETRPVRARSSPWLDRSARS